MSSNPFYDAWESATQEIRHETIALKLREFIETTKEKVPFYRERLEGFNPNATNPMHDVPALDSNQMRDLVPPQSDKLLSEKTRFYNVFQSGGTTGFPKTTLFSHRELDLLDLPNSRGFHAMGLNASDRVANVFAVGGLYMTFIHINRALQQYGCTNFPFSNQTPADFLHMATRLYKINTFTGITSVVLNALRAFPALGMDGIEIKKVFYGGVHIYSADIKELRDQFGVETIGAPGYGTVDTWYLGYQCQHSSPGTFHAHDDQVYLEILDTETGELCSPEQVGMIYATPWVRTLTPIVRYKVGDLAKWRKEPCPCGRTTPRFQLLGRGDDVLRIGYDSVDYNYVQDIVSSFAELSGTVQMVKSRVEGRDRLTLRIEHSSDEASPKKWSSELAEKLKHLVEEKFTSGRPTLKAHVQKKVIWPVEIELLPPGSIERNSRTGKLIRVVDAL